ncbi:MAG: ribonuclease H-like domain-containing protein [Myxococcaceae bacterium]
MKSEPIWQLFPEFRNNIAYVDIETTGLSRQYNEITTIALYDGNQIHTYVNGKNLEDFKTDILKYKFLVTYNGRSFDAPFIEAFFGMKLDHEHIDLRYPLKKLGYVGGLKAIEKRFGIDRGDLKQVDGFFAVRLWNEYKRTKNEKALETLLAYNCADVVNLEILMVHVFNQTVSEQTVPVPIEFKIPFQVDMDLLKWL